MSRYIDADRLIRRLENRPYKAVPNFIKMVEEQETADVAEVRHGRWINHGSFEVCSVCGEEQYGHDSGRHYCPNCGAKMDEVEDE